MPNVLSLRTTHACKQMQTTHSILIIVNMQGSYKIQMQTRGYNKNKYSEIRLNSAAA
jgi:hypothetical protein